MPKQPPRHKLQRVPPQSRQPQDSQQKLQTALQCVTDRQGWEWQRRSSQRRWGVCRDTGWLKVWSEHPPKKTTTATVMKFGPCVATWKKQLINYCTYSASIAAPIQNWFIPKFTCRSDGGNWQTGIDWFYTWANYWPYYKIMHSNVSPQILWFKYPSVPLLCINTHTHTHTIDVWNISNLKDFRVENMLC